MSKSLIQRVVLVGFSGAGKTTLAKKIAKKLNYSAIDTDFEFEKKHNVKIIDFFAENGEEKFRKLEYEILQEVLLYNNVVISSGGGLPCNFNAMQLINEKAISVYIKLSAQSLVNRLINSKTERPLMAGKTEIELLEFVSAKLLERESYYAQAKIISKGENVDIEDVVRRINQFCFE